MEHTNLNSGPKTETAPQRESLEEFLKKSGLEHVPKIETKFFFGSHGNQEDGKRVAEQIKKDDPDIFVPEMAYGSKGYLDTFNETSRGVLNPFLYDEKRNENIQNGVNEIPDYEWEILKGLYNTKKEVIFVDISEGNDKDFHSQFEEQKNNLFALSQRIWNRDSTMDFDEIKKEISRNIELYSSIQKEREEYILENMKKVLLETLQKNPELQKKETLKILISIGAFHTHLYHEMKKNNDLVSREFDTGMPYVYDFNKRDQRTMHFFGKEVFDSKQAYRSVLHRILNRMYQLFNFEQKFLDQIFNSFSEEQTRKLFEIYKNTKSEEELKEKVSDFVKNELKN